MRIRGHPAAGESPRPAFSLVELVLVLAILSTLAAVAAPRYARSLARYRADVAARRIVADLALARATARHTSSAVSVTFDIEASRVSVSGLSDMNDVSSSYVVDLSEPPYRARLVSADFGGSAGVKFGIHGQPSSAGQVVLAVGDIERKIALDGVSGKAGLQ